MTVPSADRDLINRLRSQQPRALEQLYDLYGEAMYSLAVRILSDRQEAEDLIQDIFLKLWHRCTYDPSRGSLQSFLMLMVRSRALDRLRSRQSRTQTIDRVMHQIQSEPDGRSPFDSAISNEISQRVYDALADLPEKQRQTLELSYFGGLTQQEIADCLDVPLGTVKSYFRLSFGKLRQTLQDLIS